MEPARNPSPESAEKAADLPQKAPQLVPYHFKPGQTGNPSGVYVKGLSYLRALARSHTAEAIEEIASLMRDKKQKGAVRLAAARELLDRAYGKPGIQDTDNPGKDNPLAITMADCLKRFFGDSEQMKMLEAPIQNTNIPYTDNQNTDNQNIDNQNTENKE